MARASSTLGLMLICLCLSRLFEASDSATFNVGDAGGWDFDVSDWPNGKSFSAGDVLVFKYGPQLHNVVVVDAGGYNSCSAARGSKVFTSGNDRITLAKGDNYFLCSFPGHCEQGMKIAVNAA